MKMKLILRQGQSALDAQIQRLSWIDEFQLSLPISVE